MGRNIRINVDAGALQMWWTHEEPDGEDVHATLADAKAAAVAQAVPERDAWAEVVRSARRFTRDEVLG